MKSLICFAALGALLSSAQALAAQDAGASSDVEARSGALSLQSDGSVAPVGEGRTVQIPKLTPVLVEILNPLGSATSASLQTFPIRLAAPVEVDGKVVLPAGLTGTGEVVHAKKAGGSGAPGELVLAARFLDVDGRQLRLRSMNLSRTGEGKIRTVNDLNIAAAVTVPAVALVGFLIKGADVEVPAGSLAEAKLAQDFEVIMAAPAPGSQTQEIQPEGKQDDE